MLNIIKDDLESLLDHETTKNNDVIWETLYVKTRELMNMVLKNLKSFLNLKGGYWITGIPVPVFFG